jgi:hypothetical protein
VKRFLVIALIGVALAGGACGGRDAVAQTPAKKVPLNIVPAELPGAAGDSALTLAEYKQGAARINKAGGRSMVVDGRVWEIRRGSTLVAALQVSTLRPKVDLSKAEQRSKLASLVVSGSVQKITVSGIEVVASRAADKVVFLWFGNQLFEVLQIKGAGVNPETMLKSILAFQKPTGELQIRSRA